jgi:hypothetical protein
MPADITELLIQMITGASNPNQVAAWTATSAIQSNIADDLSMVANYAQIFGTAAPATQVLAESVIGGAATAALASGGTVQQQLAAIQTFLENSAASAAATSGVVTFLAVFVAILTILATSSGKSAQEQEFQDLQDIFNALNEIIGIVLATYWDAKLTTGDLPLLWASVQADLNDIASETTAGPDVVNNVSHYHDDVHKFVILLTDDLDSGGFWSVPAQPAGNIPQSSSSGLASFGSGWAYDSWYGKFLARDAPSSGPPGDNVADPVTMLPFLALGLQSYMLIQSLVYTIDTATQLTLPQFISDFRLTELKPFLDFIYGNYQTAVNGIVKTDLPSDDEILGTLWYLTQMKGVFAHPSSNPTQSTSESWGAPWPFPPTQPGTAFSGNGFAWNLDYGASLTYPQYGYYGDAQLDQAQLNLFTPAYIVSMPDTTNAVSQWQEANILFNHRSDTYVSIDSLENWVIPWLQNRLILGRMARWKAIYLLNGFDGVWSVIQAFQQVAGLTEVPTPMRLKLDNMIASGDWWSRELCEVVLIRGNLLAGNDYVSADDQFIIHTFDPAGVPVTGHSIGGLLDFLYNVANGNWAGPPQLGVDQGPPRPLSFRGLLAGAGM